MEPAVRSRLLELRRRLEGATQGRELLDQKREALQRELALRTARHAIRRATAAQSLGSARRVLADARGELGRRAIAGAALAQSPHLSLSRSDVSLAGVRLVRLVVTAEPYRVRYGQSDSSATLDAAAKGYATALLDVVRFAEEEAAMRQLREALARTNHRLNALDLLVIPEIRNEIRRISTAIEEDERDESLRRKRWVAHQLQSD